MTISEKQLKKLARQLIEKEKEMRYGSTDLSTEQRILAVEKFLITAQKDLELDDTKKADR